MKQKKLYTIIFFVAFAKFSLFSQSNFTLKYFGLTIHPFGDYSAEIQPYKLDDNAVFVLNFGGYAGYEKFIWKSMLSFRLKQGLFTDCSGGGMSVSHLGLQMKIFEIKKHRLSFGLGPTFLVREDWNRFKLYENSDFWSQYSSDRFGDLQYKLILYGCEFEYDYQLGNNIDFSLGFTPGFPFAFTYSFGIKYWINKEKATPILAIPKN